MTREIKAGMAGGALVLIGDGGRWASGYVYSQDEAMQFIEALTSSALYLGSAMAASSGTTLALMLTLVGIVRRMDQDFDIEVYQRINSISLLSTLSLAGSVLMLLVLTLPVGEFEKMPAQWYPWLYNVLYALVIGLSALLVGTVVLLYATVKVLIAGITPSEDV